MKFTTAIDREKSRVIEANFEVGTNLEEMRELFDDQVIFESATDSIIISLQANIRRLMKAGKSDEEIEKFINSWTPGTRSPRVMVAMTPDNILKAMLKMTEEERQVILEAAKANR
jgi:hypothetical protein